MKEFLEGFSITEPEFERWLTVQRESLRSRVRQLHEAAAEDAFQERRIDEAIDHLTIALSLDPLQEHLHRRLMKLFAAEGRTDAAMAQFERCRSVLAQELGIDPDNETTALYEKIRSQRITEGDDLAGHGALSVESRIPTINPPPMVSDKPSIAVLAFENMGGGQEQEYFSDGIVEDITSPRRASSGGTVPYAARRFPGRAFGTTSLSSKFMSPLSMILRRAVPIGTRLSTSGCPGST